MNKIMALVMALMVGCCYAIGAEEAADVAVSNPWTPVIGEVANLIIQIVGPILVVLISAAVWKLLGKFGVEKNAAIDALLRTYIKQGINYADSWADKQVSKPTGDLKMAAAVKHILGLVSGSKLPKVAEEKLKEMIEAQLKFDKKNAALPNETEKPKEDVING